MNQTNHKLIEIKEINNIPENLKNTPIEDLIKYQNFSTSHKSYEKAELIVVMCMDNKICLNTPDKFACFVRIAGARITGNEFNLSFAIGRGGVKYVVIIGHTNCGMVNLASKKDKFIEGLVKNAGWVESDAESHFNKYASQYEIGNEVDFVISESLRLKKDYPNIDFIPIIYKVEDEKLYLVG